jgi:hypothetical protein
MTDLAFFFLFFAAGISPIAEKMRPEQWSIPEFAQERFDASSFSKNLEFSYGLNPFYQSGDFDGDGRLDVALLVKNKVTGKVGIVVIHSGSRPAVLLGAGTPWMGNPRYDFNWMDAWQIYPRGPVGQGAGEGKPPILKGDAILAIKTESASGLIYWTGAAYRWYQQGD